MAKPTSKIDWTKGNPDQATISVEPSAAKKEAGWLTDERPPREFMNWLFQNLGEWTDYFEESIEGFATQSIIYDATVGPGGSHADLNALMADADVANLKNVLVVGALAVDDIQVINVDGMNIEFKPKASITKNGPTGAAVGLQIDSNRVRILNGRFIGFNDGGEKGIEINGNNCLMMGNFFNDVTLTIEDNGNNNALYANIEEV
jgi:hypothetical protein